MDGTKQVICMEKLDWDAKGMASKSDSASPGNCDLDWFNKGEDVFQFTNADSSSPVTFYDDSGSIEITLSAYGADDAVADIEINPKVTSGGTTC